MCLARCCRGNYFFELVMPRGTYIQPYARGATGIPAEVFRYGYADVVPPGTTSRFGPLRVTYHGLSQKPQTQFIKVAQLEGERAHHITKAVWSSPNLVNEHTERAFRNALGAITRGLGFTADQLISLRSGQGIPNPNNTQVQ